jgi:hypothetical protein
MSGSYEPAKTAFSRVFIITGRARADHKPDYQGCMKAAGISKSFGDVESIQCPDEEAYGQFKEVGIIQGASERATTSLSGRYAMDVASLLYELGLQRCPVDVQVHLGKCTDPRVFNAFTKALILERASITAWTTEDLGALSSDENAVVNESGDISVADAYEVLPLTFQQRAPDVTTNALVDAVICDTVACGGDDCDEYSTGADKAYVLQGGQTGSPGTAPDVIYTLDKAKAWAINEVNALSSAQTAEAIACVDKYLVVFSNDAAGHAYKEKADIADVGGWTLVTDGYEAGGEPNDAWSLVVGAFVVGDGGYIYWLENVAGGPSVLDAGVATTEDLYAAHALSDTKAVAVGANDTVIYTVNRYNWSAAPATPGDAGDLLCVWMRNDNEWWVGSSTGHLYVTYDQANTWHEIALAGSGITKITDICFPKDSVGYVSGIASSVGAMWRTYDAGYSWVKLPEGFGSLPGSSTELTALAASKNDPNYVIVVGLDTTADGVLLIGED